MRELVPPLIYEPRSEMDYSSHVHCIDLTSATLREIGGYKSVEVTEGEDISQIDKGLQGTRASQG